MCPFMNFLLTLFFLFILYDVGSSMSLQFMPSHVDKLKMGGQEVVSFAMYNIDSNQSYFQAFPNEPSKVTIISQSVFTPNDTSSYLNGSLTLQGNFIGHTHIYFEVDNRTKLEPKLPVSVVREKGVMSKVFTISVAILVSLNYINMGCAVDLDVVKSVLKKPFAPAIGLVCQYAFMPLISFGMAMLLFDDLYLRMGLFVFGCSPGGGASNMWTCLLKGNLDLSLTMTFISTLLALGMMPLWLFTLGGYLFEGAATKVPYSTILMTLVSMIIPLMIGIVIQKKLPRVSAFCRRILAPACVLMIVYIIVFATYANWFMFKLFHWKLFLAAGVNVWAGFLLGALCAKLGGLCNKDVLTICIETGIQNTGITIVLLGVSLTAPDSDMAAIVPVVGSIMTPIPLTLMLLYQKFFSKTDDEKKGFSVLDDENPLPLSSSSTQSNLAPTTILTT